MSEPAAERDFTFSIQGDKLGKIRGTDVPEGMMAAPGVESLSEEGQKGRVVTQRAVSMTEGLFEFAERSNQKEQPSEAH
ncbi:MAG TPA: hypothetical protein VG122_11080 [Gemmata sp.]|jgi:hypothetical protein|nr:hypothetical protein [Gemmata sp.]